MTNAGQPPDNHQKTLDKRRTNAGQLPDNRLTNTGQLPNNRRKNAGRCRIRGAKGLRMINEKTLATDGKETTGQTPVVEIVETVVETVETVVGAGY